MFLSGAYEAVRPGLIVAICEGHHSAHEAAALQDDARRI